MIIDICSVVVFLDLDSIYTRFSSDYGRFLECLGLLSTKYRRILMIFIWPLMKVDPNRRDLLVAMQTLVESFIQLSGIGKSESRIEVIFLSTLLQSK